MICCGAPNTATERSSGSLLAADHDMPLSGCGRASMDYMGTSRRATTASALIGCAALAVYAALKAVWAMGGEVGVRDPAQWQEMLGSLTRWQLFGAFWGTVLLDAAGVALLIALAWQPSRLAASSAIRVLRALGWLAGTGLTLGGLAGLAVSVGPATGLWRAALGDPGPLADWVFIVVYGAFLAAGLAFLATATLTRPVAAGTRLRGDQQDRSRG